MHWLVIIVILLLFFGPSKLPQLGQSMGRAIRGFKEGLNEVQGEARDLPPKKEELNHEQASKAEQKQHETSGNKKS